MDLFSQYIFKNFARLRRETLEDQMKSTQIIVYSFVQVLTPPCVW